MHFCDDRSGRFDMLVSMSDKELKRLSVLQEICDQRITQSQAAQFLHISERQIRRLLQKYKAQGPAALAHAARGQTSNSRLPEELRLKCLNIVADQLHGFGPTLAHKKLTTVHGFDISVETLDVVLQSMDRSALRFFLCMKSCRNIMFRGTQNP